MYLEFSWKINIFIKTTTYLHFSVMSRIFIYKWFPNYIVTLINWITQAFLTDVNYCKWFGNPVILFDSSSHALHTHLVQAKQIATKICLCMHVWIHVYAYMCACVYMCESICEFFVCLFWLHNINLCISVLDNLCTFTFYISN